MTWNVSSTSASGGPGGRLGEWRNGGDDDSLNSDAFLEDIRRLLGCVGCVQSSTSSI